MNEATQGHESDGLRPVVPGPLSNQRSGRATARNPWIADLDWKAEPVQDRSKRTSLAILDGLESIVAQKGMLEVSILEIAKAAGCSVGAVYHHFPNKQAITYAMVDRIVHEFSRTLADAVNPARWEGASLLDILHGYLDFSLRVYRTRPGLLRALTVFASSDPTFGAHLVSVETDLDRNLLALLSSRKGEIGHAEPDLALRFVLDQIRAQIYHREIHLGSTPNTAELSNEEFVSELTQSLAGYLQIKLSSARVWSEVDEGGA